MSSWTWCASGLLGIPGKWSDEKWIINDIEKVEEQKTKIMNKEELIKYLLEEKRDADLNTLLDEMKFSEEHRPKKVTFDSKIDDKETEVKGIEIMEEMTPTDIELFNSRGKPRKAHIPSTTKSQVESLSNDLREISLKMPEERGPLKSRIVERDVNGLVVDPSVGVRRASIKGSLFRQKMADTRHQSSDSSPSSLLPPDPK